MSHNAKSNRRFRGLKVEKLESRELMAADVLKMDFETKEATVEEVSKKDFSESKPTVAQVTSAPQFNGPIELKDSNKRQGPIDLGRNSKKDTMEDLSPQKNLDSKLPDLNDATNNKGDFSKDTKGKRK